jgi:hypothetical protein
VDHSNITSLYQTRAQSIGWMVNRKRSGQDPTNCKDGESQLINKCADNVNCTAEEHQVNRRRNLLSLSIKNKPGYQLISWLFKTKQT